MPAYRSSAEAEIRDAVVSKLRSWRPNARIIHEINACDLGNRIDVIAVDRAEIIAAEVKSKKDKLDRLPSQIQAMQGVAHHVIAAIHEKFLVEWGPTNPHSAHYERDGTYYLRQTPEEARGAAVWVFPERVRAANPGHDYLKRWKEPELSIQQPLPPGAIHMLWRAELLDVCSELSVSVPKRSNMPTICNALRWQVSGGDLTKAICGALRRRECLEADPPREAA